MKLFDGISIVIILALGGAGLWVSLRGKPGATAVITTPSGEYHYSLDKNLDIHVPGLNGDYHLEIRDKKIRAVESCCPYKICVSKGWTYLSGDSIICVPEKVTVRITGGEEEIDAVTE